jgi:hypothetical protein
VQYKLHQFGSGETITAIIRKLNYMNMDSDTLNSLIIEYNKLNNNKIPYLGTIVKIPILII